MPSLQVILQMARHGLLIFRDQDSMFAFGPFQDGRIVSAERQSGALADPVDVQHVFAPNVVPSNRAPHAAGDVLVEQEGQRHNYTLSTIRIAARRRRNSAHDGPGRAAAR